MVPHIETTSHVPSRAETVHTRRFTCQTCVTCASTRWQMFATCLHMPRKPTIDCCRWLSLIERHWPVNQWLLTNVDHNRWLLTSQPTGWMLTSLSHLIDSTSWLVDKMGRVINFSQLDYNLWIAKEPENGLCSIHWFRLTINNNSLGFL